MNRRVYVRVPVEALHRAAGSPSWSALARRAGCSYRSLMRWRIEGGIPYWSADALCAQLGLHPVDVWPDWYSLEPLDSRITARVTVSNHGVSSAVAAGG